MAKCPSREELSSLLEASDADAFDLSAHLEKCAACCQLWEEMTGSRGSYSFNNRQADDPIPDFLKKLQEQLPDELRDVDRVNNDKQIAIRFPGPPTLMGRL